MLAAVGASLESDEPSVVHGAVDPRGRRQALEYLVFGPGRGGRALVVDEPGEQSAALAFDLRVHAASRRAAPTTVSDSKWSNSLLEQTDSGRSAMGTRIGTRGPFAFLPFFLVRRFLPRARYWRRSSALCGSA